MEWGRSTLVDDQWLSPGFLFLELQAAAKQHFLPSNKSGAPLTLVQLLTTSIPSHAEMFVRKLIQTDAHNMATKLKWELSLHECVQRRTPPALVRIELDGQAGIHLFSHMSDPLLLVFSAKPLPHGRVLRGAVKQMISSFFWDNGMGKAFFAFSAKLKDQCSAMFVTLCAGTEDNDIVSIGESKVLSKLPFIEFSSPCSWKQVSRSLSFRSVEHFENATAADQSLRVAEWRFEIYSGSTSIGVDIVAPLPFPPMTEADVDLSIDDRKSSVTAKIISPKSSGKVVDSFSFELPEGIEVEKLLKVKMNRSLGMISAQLGRFLGLTAEKK